MWEIGEDNWNYYGPQVQKRTMHLKHCPVCKTIFNIPDERDPFMAYCAECDTDYFFNKDLITPTRCVNHPTDRKKCRCAACNHDVEDVPAPPQD